MITGKPCCPAATTRATTPERRYFSLWAARRRGAALFILTLALAFPLAAQNPQLNAARLNQAQTYERVGQYDRAAELYQSLFDSDPRNGAYYQGLRRSLLSLRRYEELLAAINRRLTIINDLKTRVRGAHRIGRAARCPASCFTIKINRRPRASIGTICLPVFPPPARTLPWPLP